MIRPHPLANGLYEIPIEADGRLPLPPELVQTLGLEPGDIVGLKPSRDFLRIRFYREVLTFCWDGFGAGVRWSYFKEFLELPLTALEKEGVIAIPPDLLPLPPGDWAHLSVSLSSGYLWPSLWLSRG